MIITTRMNSKSLPWQQLTHTNIFRYGKASFHSKFSRSFQDYIDSTVVRIIYGSLHVQLFSFTFIQTGLERLHSEEVILFNQGIHSCRTLSSALDFTNIFPLSVS